MKTIKIGRREYDIQKGDYIIYNGACYQFCSGDGRILLFHGWNRYDCIQIAKSVVRTIDFDAMKKVEKNGLTYWFF